MERIEEIEKEVSKIAGVHPDWNKLECFRKGFTEGIKWADEHQKSPWVSVKERLPKSDEEVLVGCWCKDYFKYLSVGKYLANIEEWLDDADNTMNATHWMPIPSFDAILEANKDVLNRIKEKGD